MIEKKFVEPKVEVSELPRSPNNPEWGTTEATVYHAMISHDREGRVPMRIWESDKKEMEPAKLQEKERGFLDNVIGKYGHTSCGYQANVGLFFRVPRHTTMFLCSFDYSKYLQQSMRYTKAENFISDIQTEEVEEMFAKQDSLYNEMVDDGVEKEDARYVLPLASASHIHQNTNIIGLANIFRVLSSEYSRVPESSERIIEKGLEELRLEEPNLFRKELIDKYNLIGKGYPVANMFSVSNRWIDEIKGSLEPEKVSTFKRDIDSELVGESRNLNDQAFTFLNLSNSVEKVEGYITKLSLSAWHQFMRQDAVKQSVESVYDAVQRGEIIVPESVKNSNHEEEYLDLCQESLDLYKNKKSEVGEEKAIEIIPHSLSIYVAFSLDSYNTLSGFMNDRIQKEAQWEIREVAKNLKNQIVEANPAYEGNIG